MHSFYPLSSPKGLQGWVPQHHTPRMLSTCNRNSLGSLTFFLDPTTPKAGMASEGSSLLCSGVPGPVSLLGYQRVRGAGGYA